MTAAWMVYAVLVAALTVPAAVAVDRLFAIWQLPRRYVWVGAMVIVAAVPLVAATRSTPARLAPPPLEGPAAGNVSLSRPAITPALLKSPLAVRAMSVLRRADRPAQILWIVTSAITLGAFFGAFMVLRTRRASWKTATVDGHTTWIAPDVGPAVVGLMRPRIVLPEWALCLDDTDRRFVLRHESEHISAGDPRLLLIAGLVLVAMPWNLALWWLTGRMRLAMEIDCDARVLRGTDAIHEYGVLLLAVCERRGRSLPLVAALAEQRDLLERRILAMTASRPGRPRLVSAALGLVACAAAIAVAQAPVPQAVSGGTATTREVIVRQTPALIQKLVTDYYPTVMQGSSPINRITFVLDADGNYVTSAAWTDTAMLRRPQDTAAIGATRAFESVRMVIGGGSAGVGGRTMPRGGDRGQQSGGVGDFGALGFPNIRRDAVMSTLSGWSPGPNPLSVFIIRLK